MMEFVASKLAGAVAVTVLITSMLGFHQAQRISLEERHFRERCDSLARAIDSLSSLNAETAANVTFGEGRGELRLDFAFRDKGYEIEIRPGQVVLRQGGLTVARGLGRAVHPWDPALLGNGTPLYSTEEVLKAMDLAHPVLEIPSGKDFVLERRALALSGELAFQTFVHF